MRDHDCSVYTFDLLCCEICDITMYFSRFKCLNDILLIYKDISCKVQDHNAIFHQTHGIFIDHTLCIFQCRNMNCDIITLFINLISSLRMMNISRQSPCRIYRNIRIISVNFHSEMRCRIRYKDSDCSKSDHSKLFAFQFCTRKCFFLFLGSLRNIAVFIISFYPVDSADNISGCKQHTCDHQFLYSIRIRSRSIKYNDPFLCTTIQRNIVHTCTCTCDRF